MESLCSLISELRSEGRGDRSRLSDLTPVPSASLQIVWTSRYVEKVNKNNTNKLIRFMNLFDKSDRKDYVHLEFKRCKSWTNTLISCLIVNLITRQDFVSIEIHSVKL